MLLFRLSMVLLWQSGTSITFISSFVDSDWLWGITCTGTGSYESSFSS